MSMFVDWSVVLYFYGTCISYLILVGGTFDHLLHYYTEAQQHWYKCPSPPPRPGGGRARAPAPPRGAPRGAG